MALWRELSDCIAAQKSSGTIKSAAADRKAIKLISFSRSQIDFPIRLLHSIPLKKGDFNSEAPFLRGLGDRVQEVFDLLSLIDCNRRSTI
jgi:hypothetical protein